MHRILGLDIGTQTVKATLIEAKMRSYEILQSYVEAIPAPDQIALIMEKESEQKPEPTKQEPEEDFPAREEDEAESEGKDDDDIDKREDSGPDEPETPPAWVFGVKNLIKRTGLQFEEVICGMAGHWASTRIVSLPFSTRSKINQVLPFEVEDLVPFDMNDMVLANQILTMKKSGSTVLASMARKEDVARLLGHFNTAGIDPKVLSVNCSAISVAAAQYLESGENAAVVIDIGAQSTDVVIINHGEIALVRSITEGGRAVTLGLAQDLEIPYDDAEKLKTQVARVFGADEAESSDERMTRLSESLIKAHQPLLGRLRQTIYAAKKDGVNLEKIYLCGGGARLPGIDNLFAESLDIAVEPYPGFDVCHHNFSGGPERPDSDFVASLGLAISAAPSVKNKSVNFRIGEFAYRKIARDVQVGLKAVAAMGGLLLALLIVLIVQSHKVRGDRIAGIEQQAQKIYLETFNQPAPPGSIVASFRNKISEISNKYKVIGYLGEGNVRVLDVIRAMSESVPAEIPIDIKQFDLKSDFVKIEAITDNFQSVNKIESELGKHEIFKSVDREDAKKTVGNKIKFKLTMYMVEKTQGASGVATLMKKHGASNALPGSGNASDIPGAGNGGAP